MIILEIKTGLLHSVRVKVKHKLKGSLMAGKSVLSCEGLVIFTAGGFVLKHALTWLPLENTTCRNFTLCPCHSCRFKSVYITQQEGYLAGAIWWHVIKHKLQFER